VVPDLVTTAKGIAGGLPLAAVTGRADLMDAVHPGGLGGTYGGNPLACAAALATIETMREQDLCAAARRIESIMLPRLRGLAARDPRIGDVRGRGAMLAVEMVATGPALASAVAKACHRDGLIVLTAGTFGNVLRFLPALVIDDVLLTEGLDILDAAFAGTSLA
jgi:4-aminobutyrate aminotransferase / (S)-3-amino-2-methylpropionate transaminase / 5-aminovalerate transaminase